MLRSGGRNGDQTKGSKDVDTVVCVWREIVWNDVGYGCLFGQR